MTAPSPDDVGEAVSYTHLDVYKRQAQHWLRNTGMVVLDGAVGQGWEMTLSLIHI